MFYENWFLKTENINSFARKCAIFAFIKTASCKALKSCKTLKHTCSCCIYFLTFALNIYSSLHHSCRIGTQYSSQFQFCQVCSIKFTVLQNKIPPKILWVWFTSVFLVLAVWDCTRISKPPLIRLIV